MTDELVSQEQPEAITIVPEPFATTPELKAAIEAAIAGIKDRSYSDRHPELGKMFKCQFCGRRHRAIDSTYREHYKNDENPTQKTSVTMDIVNTECGQIFTYRQGDYELFREDENGQLVPDFRTAIKPNENPTRRQVVGAAAFAKKRIKPHLPKMKLRFIECTRAAFERLGFPLEMEKTQDVEEVKKFQEQFDKNLQRARVVAAREIRKEFREARRVRNYRRALPGRIERGLERNGSR